jgi:hypothetical protein
MRSGSPALVTRIQGGDRADGGLRRAWIEKGNLLVDRNFMGENGGSCCPEFAETTKYRMTGGKLSEVGTPVRRALFPEERVRFERGRTGVTLSVTIPPDEGRRFTVGARAGQVLDVSVSSDKISLRLIGGGDVTEGIQNFRARLHRTGDYTVEARNDDDRPLTFGLNIRIK